MGWNSNLVGLPQDMGSDNGNAAGGYQEGSEEEEPFEREFCEKEEEEEPHEVEPCDDPIPDESERGSCEEEEEPHEVEPCDDPMPNESEHEICEEEEEPYEVEPCDNLVSDEEEPSKEPFEVEPYNDDAMPDNMSGSEEETCTVPGDDANMEEPCNDPMLDNEDISEKESYDEPYDGRVTNEDGYIPEKPHEVQPYKEEPNKKELTETLAEESSKKQSKVPAMKKTEKPRKERLSVRFAAEVSHYTYNTESFAAAKFEKKRASMDDLDKHPFTRQRSDNEKLAPHLASPVTNLLDKYMAPADHKSTVKDQENSWSSCRKWPTGWKIACEANEVAPFATIKSRLSTSNQRINILEEAGGCRLSSFSGSLDSISSSQRTSNMEVHSVPQDDRKLLKELDMSNLYVANLPPSVTSHKLIELFLPFGRIVKSRVVDDCLTGLSKGYGFVKYGDPECAAEAIARMNGRLIKGRMLEVRVAGVPPSISNPSMHAVSQTNSCPSKGTDATNLYVCHLALSINTGKLLELFQPFGEVTSVTVARDQATQLSKGYGFVKYSDSRHAAEAAALLNGRLVEGKRLQVQIAGISPSASNPATDTLLQTNSRPVREIDMSKLYVCNIPLSMNTEELIDLFLPFGKVTHARVSTDRATNSSEGYGFVKFDDAQSASEAIAWMNGALIDGESLVVRVAGLSPSVSNPAPHDSPHSVSTPSQEFDKTRLYITNLPPSMTTDELVGLFLSFGQITKIAMMPDYSFVWYADAPSATKAVKHMDGYLIEGKRLVVKASDLSPTNAARHALPQSGDKPAKEIDMANLFVGNLPATVSADQLVKLFLPFGQIVQARKFNGYGMVRYANPLFAANAIDHMNGYQIKGSTLAVRIAGLPALVNAAPNAPPLPRVANEPRPTTDMANLYVCHLPPSVTTEKLIELFLPCGQITQARVIVDKVTGVSKGFGFVRFDDLYSALVAISYMNGYPLEGHILQVRVAGVHPSAMSSYMAHAFSHYTCHDPSAMAVGIPASYWSYYYPDGRYTGDPAGHQGPLSGVSTVTTNPGETSPWEGSSRFEPASSIAKKDGSSAPHRIADPASSSVSWAGPPDFEPVAVAKKDASMSNPSQACSEVDSGEPSGRCKTLSTV